MPESPLGSALMASGLSALLTLTATTLAVQILQDYAWGLFVGAPFAMGFLAAVLYELKSPRGLGECMGVATLTVLFAGVAMLVLAFEGMICLIMAAPLAATLAAVGGAAGHAAMVPRHGRSAATLVCVPIVALPLMLGTDHLRPEPPPLLKVTSVVEIAAAPEVVWRHVVSFSNLPPPKELLFRMGIAYPKCAEIRGTGKGAVRHCVFSTGPFVEPIEIWDAPHLLRFSVTSNPAPMEEWTPYAEIHPPHLNGFLVSRKGQFRLTPTEDGGTLLEGTTWYHHSLWPARYWQFWSDSIIHTIHRRVLNHVKDLAEGMRPHG